MKIYTRGGDDGSTGLPSGGRVPKSNPRVDAVGGLDEVNAAIGLAARACEGALLEQLRRIQGELLLLGAHVSAEHLSAGLPPFDDALITRLEQEIDAAEAVLPPLRNFILPGGSEASARLHLARTVCRRAERSLVALSQQAAVPPVALTYANRLGDWLFVMARLANHQAGVADVPWKPRAT